MIARVLIADDEPLARERVRDLVRAVAPAAEIREVGDGDAAVDAIMNWAPQAVFLDIQMPARDGFGVVDAVGEEHMPPTAFVTAFDAHAIRAFEVAAVDYLLKPFDDASFARTWQRLQRAHDAAAVARTAYTERFIARLGDRTIPVAVRDVRWMRSDGNYVDLFTATGTHTVREPLSSVEARLDPARFVRIHRRVVVAIDQIKEVRPWVAGDQVLVLHDGTKLRVSRTRRAALAARLEGRG